MLMIVIVLLMDIMAIVLFLRDALKPGTFLTMNILQTAFWAGVLIMDVVALFRDDDTGDYKVLGFSVFVLYAHSLHPMYYQPNSDSLSFVGLLIYSMVGYRKAKNAALRGNYAPAHNPAIHVAPPSNPPQYQPQDAYQSQSSAPLHSPYLPPYEAGAAGDYYNQQPMKPAHMV